MSLPSLIINDMVGSALREDLGHGHDSTTSALIPPGHQGKLIMRARDSGVLAGLDFAIATFILFDNTLVTTAHKKDGDKLAADDAILTIEGNAQSLLTAERTALNFLSHLSGIATKTNAFVKEVEDTKASIACTRKTLPGLRAAQKYAVRAGGGKNHRFGLDDGILIKDNHIALCGGIEQAIERAKSACGHMVKIEIEVDTLNQLKAVLEYQIDAILLDNMAPALLKEAVALVQGRAKSPILLEASGGVNIKTVRAIAQSGVDIISIGGLTHSVQALDIGLDIAL